MELHKSIPEEILVGRNKNALSVRGSLIVADKQHTKAFQDKRDKLVTGTNMSPIIIDNKPKTGYYISTYEITGYKSKMVNWRIYHPEGFEFVISTENMMEIMENCTIDKTDIQEELFFDSKLGLLSVEFPRYKALFNNDQLKQENREKRKENLVIGSKLTRIYNHVDEEGDVINKDVSNEEYIYLGKYHFYQIRRSYSTFSTTKCSKLHHVMINSKNGKYLYTTDMSPYLPKGMDLNYRNMNENDIIDNLNQYFYDDRTNKVQTYRYGSESFVVLVSKKPIKIENYKFNYITKKVKLKEIDPKCPTIITTNDGDKYILSDKQNISGRYYTTNEHDKFNISGYKILNNDTLEIDTTRKQILSRVGYNEVLDIEFLELEQK